MNTKLLILALFAVIATVSIAQPEVGCWENEEECMYQACIPENGNCYYSHGANPFDGCRTKTASVCKDRCYDDCYDCVLCLYNFGCCTSGDLVEEVPICQAACNIVPIPQHCY